MPLRDAVVLEVFTGGRVRVATRRASRSLRDLSLRGVRAPRPADCGGVRARSSLTRLVSPDSVEELLGVRRRRLRVARIRRTTGGRVIADVSLPSGKELAWLQVSKGWGTVRRRELGVRQLNSYLEAQRKAREGGRGVWQLCGGDFRSAVEEDPGVVFE